MRARATAQSHRAGFITAGVAAGAVALAVAGCGSSAPSASPGASGSATSHRPMSAHSHPMTESKPFGSDCGMVPSTGMGSFHAMSMDPVLTAAAYNPLLTTFASDAKMARLGGDLNSMHALTVFAPANSAFKKLPAAEMTMMHSAVELAKILKYHVVSGRVTPAELASGMTLKTLEGGALKSSKMGSIYEVNNAQVLCGNIRTANATVYVINKVLVPMH